jgi:uncharacterized membrane protein YwzB
MNTVITLAKYFLVHVVLKLVFLESTFWSTSFKFNTECLHDLNSISFYVELVMEGL